MKAKDFIKRLKEHDIEAEIYCRNGNGYAVPADFGIVIFPSKAVFMIGPESKMIRKVERQFAKALSRAKKSAKTRSRARSKGK